MRNEFDEVVDNKYGIIHGNNERVILIKSGAGGSFCGYEKKYLRLASDIHDKTGAHVMTAGNLYNKSLQLQDIPALSRYIHRMKGNDIQLSFYGASDGAIQGIRLQKEYPIFSQMLLVNPPLCINFHRILEALQVINIPLLFVFGSKDPSATLYFDMLRMKIEEMNKSDIFLVSVVEGADHQFRGYDNELFSLCELFLSEPQSTI